MRDIKQLSANCSVIKLGKQKLIHTNKDSVFTSKRVIQSVFLSQRPVGKFRIGKSSFININTLWNA
jgi:hypothetical protein